MASHKEKVIFRETSDEIMSRCLAAAESMKWRVAKSERNQLQIRENAISGQSLQIPIQIDLKVLPLSDGCGLEINTSSVGFGAAQTQRLQEQSTAFVEQVRYELDAPNRQKLREEADAEKRAEQQRRREEEVRIEALEAEQREAALKAAMDQLYGQKDDGNAPAAAASSSDFRAHITSAPAVPSGPPQQPTVFVPAPPPQPVQPPKKSAPPPDFVDRLERLASLHQMGALSLEEFQQAKQKLLQD